MIRPVRQRREGVEWMSLLPASSAQQLRSFQHLLHEGPITGKRCVFWVKTHPGLKKFARRCDVTCQGRVEGPVVEASSQVTLRLAIFRVE